MHFLQHMREILYYYLISQTLHTLNLYIASTITVAQLQAGIMIWHSPQYITMVTLNTSTYALVSSLYGGIQVINLASPDVSVFSNNTNNPSRMQKQVIV